MSENNNSVFQNQEEDVVRKILDAAIGTDVGGKPKSSVSFSCMTYDDVTENSKEINSFSSFNPEIKLERHFEFIQLDLRFEKAMDNDLRSLWAILESYGKLVDGYDEETSEEIPILNTVVFPISLKGQYYVSLSCPLFWVLQPETPGGQYNIIRILYSADAVDFMETDEIDVEQIEKEVKIEESQVEDLAMRQAKKERDEEEYEEQRRKLYEDMRKNPNKYQ